MLRRTRSDDDFDAEIEAHLQLERDRLEEDGLGADEARAAAHRAFGNVMHAHEHFHESGRWLWWDHLWQDVRYGARMLRKSREFTAAAVLTIALGVGATTAIFSVVDATLLRPLPYPESDQLVNVVDDLPGVGAHDVGLSQPEWLDLLHSGIFEYVSPAWFDDNNLTGSSRPARVALMSVAPNYFALLGVKPQLGRAFPPDDHSPGFTQEVVISDGLWKRDFGSDPGILDRTVRLDTDLYRIVGVMPPGFHAPGRTIQERSVDVWAATSFYGAPLVDCPPRSGRNLPTTIARVKPGLTIAAAQRRLDALIASLQKQFPGDYPASSAWTVRLVPLKETIVGDVRQPLMLLFAAVGVVLLIGCVNVANLMLARASARGREIALRQALGAAHQRLIRQLLTESVLLSLVGGLAGLAALLVMKGFLVRLVPENLPRLNDISISWGVLVFAMAATLAAGAIFGLAPVLHLRRVDLASMLKRARGASTGGETLRARRVLVVTEFALSLVLLVAAGLLLRSFWDLLHVPLGFSPQNVMAVRTRFPYPNDPSTDRYKTDAQRSPFFREMLRRSRTLPGVREVAFGNTSAIPLDHAQKELDLVPLIIEGRDGQIGDAPQVHGALVSPEYFHLMEMRLMRGRLFSDLDNEDAPGVAVINDAMARTFWPDQDPLGRHVKLSRSASAWVAVVGVVADARVESLTDAGVPEIYGNIYQRSTPHAPKHLALFLRGYLDAASLPDAVRDQIQAVDPTLPVFGAQALDEIVSATLSQRRFAIKMVGLFALTALLLAAVGTYGVISYIVSERTHEIGIRLALGAQGGLIVRTVLLQGLGLIVAGAAVGLVCAAVASRAMAGVLYGVRPTDPPTLIAVAVLLMAVGLFACYVPARRAVRVDPMIVLRCE